MLNCEVDTCPIQLNKKTNLVMGAGPNNEKSISTKEGEKTISSLFCHLKHFLLRNMMCLKMIIWRQIIILDKWSKIIILDKNLETAAILFSSIPNNTCHSKSSLLTAK